MTTSNADELSAELVQPVICSAKTATKSSIKDVCTVTPLGHGRNEVKIGLTAQTAPIEVAGYRVTTENYNANYLTPIVEAMPGDRVAAHLVNMLEPRQHDGMSHGASDQNPTNLHYFHGGIVSPNNSRPAAAELGTGDNIYVHLDASRSFDFSVPIPGDQMLDARVLESTGFISHPVGLNWYHSHLHGISSDQVMGGMSGLLSVGDATANVKAACVRSSNSSKCSNDVNKDTDDLRRRTDVRYALLRDLPLRKIKGRPDEASHSTAEWAPSDRDFPQGTSCGAWSGSGLNMSEPKLRLGFCQRDIDSAWLFTLNGQRFPTVTVAGGKNTLLRLGNLSANIGYWLELYNEVDGSVLPLTILSLDGIVPAKPVSAAQATQPVQALNIKDLLLMPASRVEVYLRNDQTPHTDRQIYVLRTKGLSGIGADEWPEIQLARIVLEPNIVTSTVTVGRNALVAKAVSSIRAFGITSRPGQNELLPEGCVRDLDPSLNEYRRVSFFSDPNVTGKWTIRTEIVQPEPSEQDEGTLIPHDPMTTIGSSDGLGIPFEDYMGNDGNVDWKKLHVCIKIDHAGSHKQLWVLDNQTTTLHNFHIHQMKFRLATANELKQTYRIRPPGAPSQTCSSELPSSFPDLKCWDPSDQDINDPEASPLWHDTIPMPPLSKVFIVMSYDAKEQLGRFVYHCHILKHEDRGLMAPIEVWEPTPMALESKSSRRRK